MIGFSFLLEVKPCHKNESMLRTSQGKKQSIIETRKGSKIEMNQ